MNVTKMHVHLNKLLNCWVGALAQKKLRGAECLVGLVGMS